MYVPHRLCAAALTSGTSGTGAAGQTYPRAAVHAGRAGACVLGLRVLLPLFPTEIFLPGGQTIYTYGLLSRGVHLVYYSAAVLQLSMQLYERTANTQWKKSPVVYLSLYINIMSPSPASPSFVPRRWLSSCSRHRDVCSILRIRTEGCGYIYIYVPPPTTYNSSRFFAALLLQQQRRVVVTSDSSVGLHQRRTNSTISRAEPDASKAT